MMLNEAAQQGVTRRIEASEDERDNTRTCLREKRILDADSPARVEKRKVRLLGQPAVMAQMADSDRNALASGPVVEAPTEARKAFEHQIEGLDAQPCWFLTRGTDVRRTIGRIHIRNSSRRFAWGTGFLVGPNLMVTNQHVLETFEMAQFSRVEFDFEETYSGDGLSTAVFDLRPDILYLSSPAEDGLDFALVAVESKARSDCQRPDANLSEFKYNILLAEEGKVLVGEFVHAIHHPEGQARQVTLRNNRLMAIQNPALDDTWLHYETDTETGSSGAPLYNNQWQLVGIHHAGVEKRDAAGRILAIGGDVWTADMGERKKWWYANEGLRVSRFVSTIKEMMEREQQAPQVLTEAGRTLVKGLLQPVSDFTPPRFGAMPIPGASSLPSKPAKKAFNPE